MNNFIAGFIGFAIGYLVTVSGSVLGAYLTMAGNRKAVEDASREVAFLRAELAKARKALGWDTYSNGA